MISATLTTLTGKKINLRIPENGNEIPLNRYFYAKYIFDQINDLFGEDKPLNEFTFLKLVVEFVGQILNVDNNDLMGFNKGTFKDNFDSLLPVKDNLDWNSIDVTLYRLYTHLGDVFSKIQPTDSKEEYEFEYKGENDEVAQTFVIPKIFNNVNLWSGEAAPNMPVWVGVELCELERYLSMYMEKTIPLGENKKPISVHEMTEEQQNIYFAAYFKHHLGILSCMVNKKGEPNTAFMFGQNAIDELIERRIEYFKNISVQTAIDCFFFGLNFGGYYKQQTLLSISGIVHNLQEHIATKKAKSK